MPYRQVEQLSHRQRELTPARFARYLVDQARERYQTWLVAALWVRHDSEYKTMAGVDCYDITRNAYNYHGPWPVICHPPCGPHGRYWSVSRQDAWAGYVAIQMADTWGGVVEQPASSQLFSGGQLVRQGDYGHPSEKLTRLYWGKAGE